jgi:phytoene/squalene synthetase
MTIAACAALVERGDHDRFRAVMAAPVAARARLFPLYAFNLEVARAPWVTQEPLIAEMRLQWWRDVVENASSGAARAHEMAGPLHEVIRDFGLPVAVLDTLIAARRWDIHPEPHAGLTELSEYLEATGAGLMWMAAKALGAPDRAEPAVRAYGWAAAAAAYLRAVPDLAVRGRQPLPESVSPQDIANAGLSRLGFARQERASVPKSAVPALLAGWTAEPVLRLAAAEPQRVMARDLHIAEVRTRGRLLWQAVSGRW